MATTTTIEWVRVGRALQCDLWGPRRWLEVMPAQAGGWRWTVADADALGRVLDYGREDSQQAAQQAALASAGVSQ